MATKVKLEAQNPLILRSQRLVEAFAKSDDERDFYLDRQEGFILYVDLDKTQQDLGALENELTKNPDRYVMIPKLTFYETKKIMEGFVNEKVYDIDTKEKLLDIIQSKEARENFLEFIYDHHSELEKWQQYYQERSRIRIIEWLRNNHFHFVFEEDLDLTKSMIEKLKKELFQTKVGKDILAARKNLVNKAKTYYSNEALNPRPKRGRPPKQAAKLEVEPQISTDIFTTVPPEIRMFLFTPDYTSTFTATFSSKFESEEELLASRRASLAASTDLNLESLNQKLATLRSLSSRWLENNQESKKPPLIPIQKREFEEEDELELSQEDNEIEEAEEVFVTPKKTPETKKVPPSPKKPLLKKKVVQKKTVLPPKKVPPKKGEKKETLRSIIKKPKKTVPIKGKQKSSKKK